MGGSCKASFLITGNCQFISSSVALEITVVNVTPNKVVCRCVEKNDVYANFSVEENHMWFCVT